MRCVSRLPPLGQHAGAPGLLHPSWVVPQVMPGDVPQERETRLPGLLVAESEPDHDGGTGAPDIQPGVIAQVLVLSYRLVDKLAKSSADGPETPPGHAGLPPSACAVGT